MNQFYNNPYNALSANILPPQQILQANGKQSIDMLRMSPNSSVLIADITAPIVWRCISDGLGNVTSEPFDIVPHKDEKQIEQENIADISARLRRLEDIINEQSLVNNTTDQSEFITASSNGKKRTKSAGNDKSINAE